MTVTRTIRYLCAHEETVRLTGGRVGVLPAAYTLHVPYECGACRVCAPAPGKQEAPRHRAAGRVEMAGRPANRDAAVLLGALVAAMPDTGTGDCAYCNATDRPDGPHAADCPWKRARDWAAAAARQDWGA